MALMADVMIWKTKKLTVKFQMSEHLSYLHIKEYEISQILDNTVEFFQLRAM